MAVQHLRLVLASFFLIVSVGLFVVLFGFPEVAERFNTTRLCIGAVLALVFAGLNVARWYAAVLAFQRRATPVRQPFQRNPDAVREETPNPDFDFSKADEDKRNA